MVEIYDSDIYSMQNLMESKECLVGGYFTNTQSYKNEIHEWQLLSDMWWWSFHLVVEKMCLLPSCYVFSECLVCGKTLWFLSLFHCCYCVIWISWCIHWNSLVNQVFWYIRTLTDLKKNFSIFYIKIPIDIGYPFFNDLNWIWSLENLCSLFSP